MTHRTPVVHRVTPLVSPEGVTSGRIRLGRSLIFASSLIVVAAVAVQLSKTIGVTDRGFANWRPVAFAFVLWAVALNVGLVLARGVRGERAVFLLPAVLLTIAFVIFPTIFGLYIAFTDWNLSSVYGRRFNGLGNFRKLYHDGDFRHALSNMMIYMIGVLAQYVIGFGLALLVNQDIRGRKFFRVAFLLPFMLSPVAISWMIGKSILDVQNGPLPPVLDKIGFHDVSFYENPWLARLNIMMMDAWYSIPFVFVLLLAGLQALPHEVIESARVDGGNARRVFWDVIYPLMLPVSLTAIVLRVIFEFKLVDIVLVTTEGGPAGATETVTSFIYREGVAKTNVGYATALSQFYLVFVIVFVTIILSTVGRWVRKFA